ncbi:hypothetical protein Rhe02_16330 [Rhizocola hellebori]|uniref:Lipoprotein n=1 Tax=Rhizocola hellebori TaxID=1392758 RepID=A0A8J3VES4_9ACTN|nr:hypothetical protein [Rhizocola hellebori]GIH03566.1 hypothetical protein Rhe02_16330 [Rhizocola hellebori]
MTRLLLIALLATGIAGCSGPDDNGIASANGAQPTATASAKDDPVAFSQCMREHGQHVPDPGPGGTWEFNPHPRTVPTGWDEAIRACQHLIEMPTDDGMPPEDMEKLRAFAVCMREHDIPVTDPQIGGDRPGNMRIGGRFEDVTRDQLEADPVYKAAYAACKDKLPTETKKGS